MSGEEVRRASSYPECHEEVSRQGQAQPCDKPAVALRIDPNEGGPYTVCKRHVRGDIVPLITLVAALVQPSREADAWDRGYGTAAQHAARGSLGSMRPGNPYRPRPTDDGTPGGTS